MVFLSQKPIQFNSGKAQLQFSAVRAMMGRPSLNEGQEKEFQAQHQPLQCQTVATFYHCQLIQSVLGIYS